MWKETAVTEPPGLSAPPAAQPSTENELRTILPSSKALKVFAMILFDVIAEIRHDRNYRKEFEGQSPPLPAPSVSGSNRDAERRTPMKAGAHGVMIRPSDG
jgi:hypothetical protein